VLNRRTLSCLPESESNHEAAFQAVQSPLKKIGFLPVQVRGGPREEVVEGVRGRGELLQAVQDVRFVVYPAGGDGVLRRVCTILRHGAVYDTLWTSATGLCKRRRCALVAPGRESFLNVQVGGTADAFGFEADCANVSE
jgi:hypothetical protein